MLEDANAAQIGGSGRPEMEFSAARKSPGFIELWNTLPNDVHVVSPFVDQVLSFLSGSPGADENRFEIELALREALVNAIVHGNQEDPQKRIHVRCRLTTDGEVSMTVRDEGLGFEHDAVADPTTPENRLRAQGRGISLMRALMDEVVFNAGGSVVQMRKRAKSAAGLQ